MHQDADVARNRHIWSIVNQLHTDAAAEAEWRRAGISWGLFRIPEDQLRALPPLDGLSVVELGAGTAFLSASLARAGAKPIAVDVSHMQLVTAARCQAAVGPAFPLVEADGQRVPLRDDCADLVVSEHGASVWCDPQLWLAEAMRLLRPEGWLVFLTSSVLAALCVPEEAGPAEERLQRSQRGLYRTQWEGGGVEYHPSHGQWIELLRRHGFVVDRLRELYAPADAADPAFYEIADAAWSQRWPVEELWVARRQ